MTAPRLKNTGPAYVNFGGGFRFVSVDYIYRELAPLGISRQSTFRWLEVMHIPMIRIAKTWIVELFLFHIALAAISRIGRPNFMAPGTVHAIKMKTRAESRYARGVRDIKELDVKYFIEDFEQIIAEMLARRTVQGLPDDKATRKAARIAAERLARLGIDALPTRRQREAAKARLRSRLRAMDAEKVARVIS